MAAFDQVVNSNNMPAVSFLKAPQSQDGHPGSSDPIDEQALVAKQVNAIQNSKNWDSTVVILAYDDSDGWYDHVAAAVKNSSNSPDDAAFCLNAYNKGVPMAGGYADRCGPGTRQPLIVVSPFAKTNFVDHTQTDQTSILRLIEDNWSTGQIGSSSLDAHAASLTNMFDFKHPNTDKVILNPTTGAVVPGKDSNGNDDGNHYGNGQNGNGNWNQNGNGNGIGKQINNWWNGLKWNWSSSLRASRNDTSSVT